MPILLWLVGGGVAAYGASKLVSTANTAVTDTTNSTIKLAIVGVGLFIAAKHYKVI